MDDFEPYPVPPTLYFGERWDAPMLDENVQQIDVPVGQSCMYCSEPIKGGERGLMRLALRGTPENPVASQEPAHMECDLRTMIGDVAHLEGRCSCSGGAGIGPSSDTYRQEGLAVLDWVNQERAASGRDPL